MVKNFLSVKIPLAAVVGVGNFGSLWVKLLLERTNYNLFIYDKNPIRVKQIYNKLNKKQKYSKRLHIVSLRNLNKESLTKIDIVFFATPPQYFTGAVNEWIKYLSRNVILVDLLSVKVYPLNVLKDEKFNRFKRVLMHPMFGPNAIKVKAHDWPIVYWPLYMNNGDLPKQKTSSDLETWAFNFIKSLQMSPMKLNPYEHDKAMAYTQFLAHLMGILTNKIADSIYKKYSKIMPGSARKLMELSNLSIDLSESVFNAMYLYNPFSKDAIESLLKYTLEQLFVFYKNENSLEKQRELIDSIDDLILKLFSIRFKTVKRIKSIKSKLNKGIVDKNRYSEHLNILMQKGEKLSLSKEFIKVFYDLLHEESVRLQKNLS